MLAVSSCRRRTSSPFLFGVPYRLAAAEQGRRHELRRRLCNSDTRVLHRRTMVSPWSWPWSRSSIDFRLIVFVRVPTVTAPPALPSIGICWRPVCPLLHGRLDDRDTVLQHNVVHRLIEIAICDPAPIAPRSRGRGDNDGHGARGSRTVAGGLAVGCAPPQAAHEPGLGSPREVHPAPTPGPLTGAMQLGKLDRVPAVGLDTFPRLARDQRWHKPRKPAYREAGHASGEHVVWANMDDLTCQDAGERVRGRLLADSGRVAERCLARIQMIQNLAAATHRRHVVLP
jgi:hypothetical protein